MNNTLQANTIERLHSLAKECEAQSVEQLVLMALQSLDSNLYDLEPDDDTWAAIERAEKQPSISADEMRCRLASRKRRKQNDL